MDHLESRFHRISEEKFVMKNLLVAALAAATALSAQSAVEKRLEAATIVINETMAEGEKSIPKDLLIKSECAVVVPGLKKGAFIVGARFGRGFLTCRTKDGSAWTAPGAIKIEGGSIGLQAGGAEVDVVLLIMNQSGINKLLNNKFTIAADASVAGGPVGRDTTAATDAQMRAEILSYSRSRGVFAGVSLAGATIREDEDAIAELYGAEKKKAKNREILAKETTPTIAQAYLNTLTKYSARRTN
jgi:lipid-binding SYLF domain-containing protein